MCFVGMQMSLSTAKQTVYPHVKCTQDLHAGDQALREFLKVRPSSGSRSQAQEERSDLHKSLNIGLVYNSPREIREKQLSGARRVPRMKQKFWPERKGMKNKSAQLRNYIACGSHSLCFLLHMQRGCRIRFPNPNALGLIL